MQRAWVFCFTGASSSFSVLREAAVKVKVKVNIWVISVTAPAVIYVD